MLRVWLKIMRYIRLFLIHKIETWLRSLFGTGNCEWGVVDRRTLKIMGQKYNWEIKAGTQCTKRTGFFFSLVILLWLACSSKVLSDDQMIRRIATNPNPENH